MEEKPGVYWLINLNATDYWASYMTLVFNLSELQSDQQKNISFFHLLWMLRIHIFEKQMIAISIVQARGKMGRLMQMNHKNEKETWKHQEPEHPLPRPAGKLYFRQDSLSTCSLDPVLNMDWP